MSNHSIEELERQLQAAKDRFAAANEAVVKAKSRLEEARLDATGLRGHLVSFRKTTWRNPEGAEIRFVVESAGRWTGEVAGRSIKKDGSFGERRMSVRASVLTDHGLYTDGGTP